MWSDAARQAALEARQANAKGRAAAVGDHQNAQTAPVGPGRQPVRIDSEGSPATKTYQGSAKSERITAMRAVDQRHYGIEGADRTAKTDLGQPAGTHTPAGKMDPRINAHVNEIMRRAGSPAAVVTAGQAVAAGLTGSTKG